MSILCLTIGGKSPVIDGGMLWRKGPICRHYVCDCPGPTVLEIILESVGCARAFAVVDLLVPVIDYILKRSLVDRTS